MPLQVQVQEKLSAKNKTVNIFFKFGSLLSQRTNENTHSNWKVKLPKLKDKTNPVEPKVFVN